MPWNDYPEEIRQFSGLVQAAAGQRFGAAATSEIIAQAARDAGITLGFQSYTGIARLYGAYVGVRSASEALASGLETVGRTGIDQGVRSDMIASAPYSPASQQWTLNPYVIVKAQYSQETPEGPLTSVFSHRYRLDELTTLGALLADMQAQLDVHAATDSLGGGTVDTIVSLERANP